jgi:aspartyl-tRNA(Asn)/glutamyl-tRNA(Gln) amidotransferase subunit C
MPTVSATTVEAIARLARLALTPQEISQSTQDLNGILANFSRLQHIDTADIPITETSASKTNLSRPDIVLSEQLCPTEALLDRAPQLHQAHFQVKAIL